MSYLFLALTLTVDLVSPFQSTVPGISIYNTHIVDTEGQLLRGMRPRSDKDIQELLGAKVTDILIFRDSPKGEDTVESELALLRQNGFPTESIEVIPFKWKGIESFSEACEQTVDALKLMRTVENSSDRKLFFHCTVGEDRTGYLAGLYRILNEQWSPKEAYQKEMCENGYADGNPIKPDWVVAEVHANISVLYSKMVELIQAGQLSLKNLNREVCVKLDGNFERETAYGACESSPHYDPSIR